MDEISKALPDLVWLTELDVAGNQITLKGKTLSPNAVATYLENLKKSPFFAEPVFKNLGREGGLPGHLQLGDDADLHARPGRSVAAAAGAGRAARRRRRRRASRGRRTRMAHRAQARRRSPGTTRSAIGLVFGVVAGRGRALRLVPRP